mgnify:FL=1
MGNENGRHEPRMNRVQQGSDHHKARFYDGYGNQIIPKRDLHIFTSPNTKKRIHSTLIPPILTCCEHSHGNWGCIVFFAPTAPELPQICRNSGRAAYSMPGSFGEVDTSFKTEIDKVNSCIWILHQIPMRCG